MDTNTLGELLDIYVKEGDDGLRKINEKLSGKYDLRVNVKVGGKTKNNLFDTYNIKRKNPTWINLMAVAKVLHWFAAVEPSKDIKDEALGDFFEHFYKADIKTKVKLKKIEWNLNPLVYAAAFKNHRVFNVLLNCDRFPNWHADENTLGNILETVKRDCSECNKNTCDSKKVGSSLKGAIKDTIKAIRDEKKRLSRIL